MGKIRDGNEQKGGRLGLKNEGTGRETKEQDRKGEMEDC